MDLDMVNDNRRSGTYERDLSPRVGYSPFAPLRWLQVIYHWYLAPAIMLLVIAAVVVGVWWWALT